MAGGQPTITYVERSAEHIELKLARAIATPNQIVSLSGPTKTGKTVLCRRTLRQRQFVWIDGGQVKGGDDFWSRVSYELNLPDSSESTTANETKAEIGGSIPLVLTANGSQLLRSSTTEKREIGSLASAITYLTQNRIMLVIDDFHYIAEECRAELMRNVKGAVFNGLKVILLSVTHRVFDAIKAETELTGRFTAISLPHWSTQDLAQIPIKGFDELGADCPDSVIAKLCAEAQESPFLMQKFCWEICFDRGIEYRGFLLKHAVPENYDLPAMFKRLSLDAGLPIYQKLAAGPQSRKVRAKRSLRGGGVADIYQALLLALAESGPKAVISCDELRESLNQLLLEQIPQKHEITSALKHLSRISREIGAESAVDWDDDNREINLVDPYLRFYLRWQVRQKEKV
ncbi:MAG: TniB family NTP-binding protein [Acidobacteriota bacterium]|nr:TniB family NTP-binding protein [Acidobacteriota bacterium]